MGWHCDACEFARSNCESSCEQVRFAWGANHGCEMQLCNAVTSRSVAPLYRSGTHEELEGSWRWCRQPISIRHHSITNFFRVTRPRQSLAASPPVAVRARARFAIFAGPTNPQFAPYERLVTSIRSTASSDASPSTSNPKKPAGFFGDSDPAMSLTIVHPIYRYKSLRKGFDPICAKMNNGCAN